MQNLAMFLGGMFLGGLLGSGHCIGMCGGFALSVGGLCPRMPAGLVYQGIYSAGRMFTYSFLGAMAGWAGARLGALDGALATAQRILAVGAGLIMVGLGTSQLGWPPLRHWAGRVGHALTRKSNAALVTRVGTVGGGTVKFDDGLAVPFFRHFLRPRERRGVFLAGVFTGFLPCGLVYAFLALAASSGDPLTGWLGMACFGLGTVPAMALAGCGGSLASARWRGAAARVAAGFVVLLGALTVYRGLPAPGGHCHVSRPVWPA